MSSFLRRLGFFLAGLLLGVFILKFFLERKQVSFDYFPNARTLKSIRNKQFQYSDKALEQMKLKKIDSTIIENILIYGDVEFRKSNIGKSKCNTYVIVQKSKINTIEIWVERCDSVSVLKEVQVN